MISILVADDQRMFREGILRILKDEKDFDLKGEVASGEEVVAVLAKSTVDVVILDIDMPGGMDGIQTTKHVKENYPNVKVVILSMYANKEFVLSLMRFGASAYILKNRSSSELCNAIRNVMKGQIYYGLEVMVYATGVSDLDLKEDVTLSKREIQVLKGVANGHSNKEIAEDLNISKLTVDKHIQNIAGRLEVRGRVNLVRYALKNRIVEL